MSLAKWLEILPVISIFSLIYPVTLQSHGNASNFYFFFFYGGLF